jgi:hypothetical protein
MLVFEIDAATIDNYLGNLRRGGVIEIDERFPVDDLTKHREVFTDAFHVETAVFCYD